MVYLLPVSKSVVVGVKSSGVKAAIGGMEVHLLLAGETIAIRIITPAVAYIQYTQYKTPMIEGEQWVIEEPLKGLIVKTTFRVASCTV